jgi:hypothetical protein
VAKNPPKRAYDIPVEIRTGIPCKDREDFLSSVRIASSAKCIDRIAICNGTGNQIVFRASCRSTAAKKRFEEEVGHVIYFLSRRPK